MQTGGKRLRELVGLLLVGDAQGVQVLRAATHTACTRESRE